MAKIYSTPKEIAKPTFDWEKVNEWKKQEEEYINNIKAWLTNNGYTGKNAGKTVSFPMADSAAVYIATNVNNMASKPQKEFNNLV